MQLVLLNRMLSRSLFHVILIAALGILVYSNTLDVPFQFDDTAFTINNPVVKDFNYFLDPSLIDDPSISQDIKHLFRTRLVTILSFWANYRFGGQDVTGYHIVNIIIHVINALLVYLTVMIMFKTPFLMGSILKERSWIVALFSGLLFVAHPVQTMAVTYIVQRWASLAALFYLLAIVLYMKYRLRKNRIIIDKELRSFDLLAMTFYILSLLSAVLAMKTKEIAFTLPLMIALCEVMFFQGNIRKRLFCLIPFLATMLIIPYSYILLRMDLKSIYDETLLSGATKFPGAPDRWDYFLSQFGVISTYIRLLFMPVGQSIYYDDMLRHSFSDPLVFLPFIFLLFVFFFGLFMFLHSRKGEPALSIVSFGIFWFFLALSVESSILPIMDVLCEYRVYLPAAGAFMAISSGVVLFVSSFKHVQKSAACVSVAAVLVFSGAAYARNTVWKSEISLWEDTVKKAPGNLHGHFKLGTHYLEKKQYDKAIYSFKKSLHLKEMFTENHPNPRAYFNIGLAYYNKGMLREAIRNYEAALGIMPFDEEAHYNVAIAYNNVGMKDKAIEHYMEALRIKPSSSKYRFNLALTYLSQGRMEQAQKEFEEVLRREPWNRRARKFLDYVNKQPRG